MWSTTVLVDSPGPYRRAVAHVLSCVLGEVVCELPEESNCPFEITRRAMVDALSEASCLVLNASSTIEGTECEHNSLLCFSQAAVEVDSCCKVVVFARQSLSASTSTALKSLLKSDEVLFIRGPLRILELTTQVVRA